MPLILQLPPDEAHLWFVRPEAIAEDAALDAYAGLLAPDERARHARLHFARHRHEFLLTRALARAVLSRYAPVAPAAWTFRANTHGRPAISGPPGAEFLRFNLSNTDGLVACLVARDREVGVDVEPLDRRGETVTIADRYFSPREVADLRALPEAAQRARFFDYWTLKEAYIKARGMGLAIPLEHFSFALAPDGPITIAFDPRLPDDPARWHFAQFRPTARHLVATAVERNAAGRAARIVVRETLPLRDPE